jgi:hypothetical protein
MRFVEFQSLICEELLQHPKGFTWAELGERLDLPYDRPCSTWVKRLEEESGLTRARGSGRAYLWKLPT